jgi:hypothetical protein
MGERPRKLEHPPLIIGRVVTNNERGGGIPQTPESIFFKSIFLFIRKLYVFALFLHIYNTKFKNPAPNRSKNINIKARKTSKVTTK